MPTPVLRPLSLRQSLAVPVLLLTAGVNTSFAAEPAPVTKLDKLTVEEEAVKPNTNPRAQDGAPYKVNEMASPLYTRPIADTPKTLQVISKEAIQDAGAQDLADVIRSQPGITLGTGEGGNAFGDRFIIRGFEARNDIFVDGVRDPGVTTREIFAVEQIEVAKGPSASFAGRGTTGGAINNVTKKAGPNNFTDMDFGLGTDAKKRVTLDNNTAFNDELALRTNLMYGERDLPARGLASEQRQGAALAGAWKPSQAFSLLADYYYQASDDVPDGGIAWDPTTGKPIPGRDYFGQIGRDFWQTSSDIATLVAKWDISDTLHWQTTLRDGKTTNRYVISISGLAATPAPAAGVPVGVNTPGMYVRANSQNRNQTNESQAVQSILSWDMALGGMQHSWVFGLEAAEENITNLPYTDSLRSANAGVPGQPNNFFWRQNGGKLTVNPAGYSTLTVESHSVFLMDTWTLNAQWEVFAGLRADQFDFTVNSGATAYTGATNGARTTDESMTNGHLGVVYKPTDSSNVYLNLSTSSNPTGEQLDSATNCAYGGLCQNAANAGAAAGFTPTPEKNTNYELGSKWELFDDKLLLSGALFQIIKEDVISTTNVPNTTPPVTLVNQIGELQVRGIELAATGTLTEKLSVQAGITWLDTEVTRSDTASEVGQKFPNTAEQSLTAQVRYQLLSQLALGGTLTYKGEIWGGTPNGGTTNNKIEANTRLDLMADWEISDTYSLQFNLLNATDEVYYDALYRSATPFTYVGEGRGLSVTAKMSF
ncbi:MAG: hypothetical protein RL497_1260 [Pseudomonadota bacterium]